MKTVTFSIMPLNEVADDLSKTFDAVRKGRRIPKQSRDEAGFTSIEAARNFLTRERLALMRTIRNRHPGSLYELAKMVNRDFKNVQEDIGILERHGLVRISKEPRGKRKVKVPQVLFEEIALKIAIWTKDWQDASAGTETNNFQRWPAGNKIAQWKPRPSR